MSAIAYITDSKMLELHRLNNHKAIHFWRLSANTNFSDFAVGDLVFFLSKDKEHRKKKEKGIVGFGRLQSFTQGSVRTMWDRYGIQNGYLSLEEFKEAILKVSKDRKLPKRISGFYLENVTFFQPVYLSECGMHISSNIESYIYLKEETVPERLKLAMHSDDLWSTFSGSRDAIEKEMTLYALFRTHRQIGDIKATEKYNRRALKELKRYLEEHEGWMMMQNSENEVCRLKGNDIGICFYHDKDSCDKLLIGQAMLYRYYLYRYCDTCTSLRFYCSDGNEELEHLLNVAG